MIDYESQENKRNSMEVIASGLALFIGFFLTFKIICCLFDIELQNEDCIYFSILIVGFFLTLHQINRSRIELIKDKRKQELISYAKEAYELFSLQKPLIEELKMINDIKNEKKISDLEYQEMKKTLQEKKDRGFHRAVILTRLFGNKLEIGKVDDLLNKARSVPPIEHSFDDILILLRKRLRRELGLGTIKELFGEDDDNPWVQVNYRNVFKGKG